MSILRMFARSERALPEAVGQSPATPAVLQRPCKPLVIGAPRSGFVLCLSVLQNLVTLFPPKGDLRQRVLDLFTDAVDDVIAGSIRDVFARRGAADRMIYNGNFQQLRGGPSWLKRDGMRACFRKYIGMVGKGDLTLNIAHPREVLDHDRIVSSHTDPVLWAASPPYADYIRFSSVRHPAGILNSACFSLNALTSEYIQRFLPPNQDNDDIRLKLGLYKLTDLTFFEGLTDYLAKYFDEFMRVRDRFHIMRWEELITEPVKTIKSMGRQINLEVSDEGARRIWAKLDHVNLTGHHKHNYRQGKGIVGDWKKSLTNRHLEIMRRRGLETMMAAFGYGQLSELDESAFTEYQRTIDDHIQRGVICDPTEDRDLFGFAFNKSNINAERFPFRTYGWKTHTQLERTCYGDTAMEQEIWEVAEESAGRVNALLDDVVAADFYQLHTSLRTLDTLESAHARSFDSATNARVGQAVHEARALARSYYEPAAVNP